jgi:hypothetical protein
MPRQKKQGFLKEWDFLTRRRKDDKPQRFLCAFETLCLAHKVRHSQASLAIYEAGDK